MSCEQEHALHEIMVLGFALDDALLYLDTHLCDECALRYYQEQQAAYRCAKEQYTANFGPLQLDEVCAADTHIWAVTPWPWEMEE